MKRKILVTGIGGVVGQGILRNISGMSADIEIVGVNVVGVSAGNYLCDKVFVVPYAYDDAYIPAMQKICREEQIDLIIPSTDYEAYYLAGSSRAFGCPVAASPAEVTKMCLDKYMNYVAFQSKEIPFATSVLPSEYKNTFPDIVVKPREGRGSRNIFINPPDVSSFDDSYVVQPYLNGPEITTSFYVTKAGQLHGHITFVRELEQGNTAKAEVVREYDKELDTILKKMIKHYHFRGSCNVQSRVTPEGIVPFEINCRISGTNSVRSQFGFSDVEYTVQEYLFGEQPSKPEIREGTALRVIVDIIYPGRKMNEISNKNDQFYIR